MCAKENEFKSLLNSLCYFHACVVERRKFGPQGWNRSYPYNTGDLTISVNVLYNYLENNAKVPWTDLRYLFGEIMYGGHITDDWDRRLCKTYLEEFMKPEQVGVVLFQSPVVLLACMLLRAIMYCLSWMEILILLPGTKCLQTQTIKDTISTLMTIYPPRVLFCMDCILMLRLAFWLLLQRSSSRLFWKCSQQTRVLQVLEESAKMKRYMRAHLFFQSKSSIAIFKL